MTRPARTIVLPPSSQDLAASSIDWIALSLGGWGLWNVGGGLLTCGIGAGTRVGVGVGDCGTAGDGPTSGEGLAAGASISEVWRWAAASASNFRMVRISVWIARLSPTPIGPPAIAPRTKPLNPKLPAIQPTTAPQITPSQTISSRPQFLGNRLASQLDAEKDRYLSQPRRQEGSTRLVPIATSTSF
jgi:hypothetical protein